MINDEESLLRSVRDYVKANLNAQIVLINTEKGDFSIDQITADDDHYVISGETYDLPNHIFVNFAISGEIETQNNYDNILSIPNIMVEVAFDNPKAPNTYFKSLRYMRALYQTIVRYQDSTQEIAGMNITKMVPMVVANNKRELVISGIELSTAIA